MGVWGWKKQKQAKATKCEVVVLAASETDVAVVRKALRGAQRLFGLRSTAKPMSLSTSSSTMSVSEVDVDDDDDAGSILSDCKPLTAVQQQCLQAELRRAEDFLRTHKGSRSPGRQGDTFKLKCLPEESSYDDGSLSSISTQPSTRGEHECGICSEPLLGLRFVGACLPCGHCFHEDCFYGSWASALLQGDEANEDDTTRQLSRECCAYSHCFLCGMVVRDFGRLSINVADAMGPPDGYDNVTSDFAFRKLFARAKMVTLVRRCISVPSSPKVVCEVLRMTMDRIRRMSDVDSGEPGMAVKSEFLAVGGHVAMVHALTRYGENAKVCGWVNAIMADLSVSHADVLFLTTPHLCDYVAASMLKHPVLQPLQSNGCCTFSELCKSTYAALALQDIDKAQGLGAVTDAIARFPLEAGSLRWNAVSFLTLAAEVDPYRTCEHVCSDMEAFECIVSTLHESLATLSPEFGRLVCRLLLIAARRPEFRSAIAKAGATEALQAVYMRSMDVNSKDMSKAILGRLGRPLNPYQRSHCVAI